MKSHVEIIQGPRNKNNATLALENLIKAMLQAHSNKQDITVAYNAANEMTITVNNYTYNLTKVLEGQPDWEQLTFSEDDIACYDKFLHDPAVVFGHISIEKNQYNNNNNIDKVNFKKIAAAFPNLTLAECSAVRNYTDNFYLAINFLLRNKGKEKFPATPMREFALAVKDFRNIDGSYKLNELVTEILLHSAFTVSALSKPVQGAVQICISPSLNEVKKALDEGEIKSHTLVIIGEGDARKTALIVSNEIVHSEPLPTFIINSLLNLQNSNSNFIKFSDDEIVRLTKELNNTNTYRILELGPLNQHLLANLSIMLGDDVMYPTVTLYRADKTNDFMTSYVKEIQSELNHSNGSLKSANGFYSTSDQLQRAFIQGIGVITALTTSSLNTRNITPISKHPHEAERLFIHGQELMYTAVTSESIHTKLCCEPTRSLGKLQVQPAQQAQPAYSPLLQNSFFKAGVLIAIGVAAVGTVAYLNKDKISGPTK